MALRVIGAGLARTGTTSLKLALEQLLGGPCYHMFELFAHPDHIPAWHQAARGQHPDWDELLHGYQAAVDLPASAFWQELATASPDALIILSVRDSAEQWWHSASQTVFNPALPSPPPDTPMAGFLDMITEVLRSRLGMTNVTDKDAMISAYERHNDAVRALAPPGRLLEWRPSDGWVPITEAFGLTAQDRPFPKVNTRSEFRVPELGQPVHWPPSPPVHRNPASKAQAAHQDQRTATPHPATTSANDQEGTQPQGTTRTRRLNDKLSFTLKRREHEPIRRRHTGLAAAAHGQWAIRRRGLESRTVREDRGPAAARSGSPGTPG